MNPFELPAPQDDGLLIPEVGPWSRDKHHFLRRYLHAFCQAMRKKKWDGLHYIDLFAGAGVERLKGSGDLDWGSPLIAAQLPKGIQFDQMHLVELDEAKVAALQARLTRFKQPIDPQILAGDANIDVLRVVDQISAGSLSLAFLDPYGLDVHFETLRVLARRRTDLIIFFPDHLEVLRNWGHLYEEDSNSRLDLVLGGAAWRQRKSETTPTQWSDLLTQLYVEQIKKLGYKFFEYERITLPNGRFLYKLIYCSRAEIGASIWRNVARRKPDGQDSFDFH